MARVDYSGVPDVSARVQAPDDYTRVDASPNAFGAQVAQGAEKLGAGAIDASKFYGQVAADNGTNDTIQQVGNILYGNPSKSVIGQDGQPIPDSGYFGMRGADAMRARPDVTQQIDDIIQQNRENLSTPESQYQYDVDTRRARIDWMTKVGGHADEQQKTWSIDTNNTSAQLGLVPLARNPNDPNAFQQATQTVRNAYVKNAQIAGEDTAGAILKADQAVALTQVRALLETDPAAALTALNSNQQTLASLPNYDAISNEVKTRANAAMAPQLADQFIKNAGGAPGALPDEQDVVDGVMAANLPADQEGHVITEVNRRYAIDRQASAATERAKKAAAEDAGNRYVSQILSGRGANPNQIANDPDLDWRDKAAIFNMQKAHEDSANDARDTKTYGPGFYKVYQNMNLPADDPNKITDAKQLWNLAGPRGALTVAGVDKLSSVLAGKNTPEGEAAHTMMQTFLKNAHDQLSGADDLLHQKDPQGEELFLKFQAHAFPAYDAGVKAGKTPAQLLSPDSPDYLGKSITTMKRTDAQRFKDLTNATDADYSTADAKAPPASATSIFAGILGGAPPSVASTLKTSADIIAAAKAGRISRKAAADLLVQRGYARAEAPPAPPAGAPGVPTVAPAR